MNAVIGLDSLLSKLAATPSRVMRATEGVLAQSAQQIEAGAKERAPKDSGELEQGIQAKPGIRTEDRSEYLVESEAPHTIHVEFGTSDMPAQPMLRPAFDENVGPTVRKARAVVRRALVK